MQAYKFNSFHGVIDIYTPPQAKWNNVKERVFFLKTTE